MGKDISLHAPESANIPLSRGVLSIVYDTPQGTLIKASSLFSLAGKHFLGRKTMSYHGFSERKAGVFIHHSPILVDLNEAKVIARKLVGAPFAKEVADAVKNFEENGWTTPVEDTSSKESDTAPTRAVSTTPTQAIQTDIVHISASVFENMMNKIETLAAKLREAEMERDKYMSKAA